MQNRQVYVGTVLVSSGTNRGGVFENAESDFKEAKKSYKIISL